MRIGIIADDRFFRDVEESGEARQEDWDKRPRYLLGKIIHSPQFHAQVQIVRFDASLVDEIVHTLSECALVLFHVDRTRRPPELTAIAEQLPKHIKLLNKSISDTSKRTLGRLLGTYGLMTPSVGESCDGASPVIIKSNYNSGDAPNRMYKVVQADQVSEAELQDDTLIVQRFVRETFEHALSMDGTENRKVRSGKSLSRLRRILVVGNELVYVDYFSVDMIIKRSTSVWQYARDVRCLEADLKGHSTRELSALGYHFRDFQAEFGIQSEVLQQFLREFGLEFGTIDIITPCRDEMYILDVNLTPWERGVPKAIIQLLAEALPRAAGER